MSEIQTIFTQYQVSPFIGETFALLQQSKMQKISIKGITSSILTFINAALFEKSKQNLLFILDDKESAAYALNELENLLGKEKVFFFPASYRRPYEVEETENANVLMRAEVLNAIFKAEDPIVILTYPDALFEKVVTQATMAKNTLKIKIGDKLSTDFINETLFEYQFKRVDFVTEPGEFSVRGGIIDIFSFSNDFPYRIEFFGDEIDSIRTFDVENQLSIEKKTKIDIVPNLSKKVEHDRRVNFFEYIAQDSIKTLVSIKNIEGMMAKLEQYFNKALEKHSQLSDDLKHSHPETLFISRKEANDILDTFSVLEFQSNPYFKEAKVLEYKSEEQPSFNKKFELLAQNFDENTAKGYQNFLLCSTETQIERFKDIFHDIDPNIKYNAILGTIHQGFVDKELQIVCYTDHQIFERYHKFKLKSGFDKKEALTLRELNSLEVGDYVTHIDHGIGKFGGLMQIDNNGVKQEAIKLVFQNNDILYVNIHSLHKITKYNGKDGMGVKLSKLGSPAWKNLKNKTKARVKEIAFDLIKLYAKRRTQKGFAFAPDTYLQHELEASFMYEDTPDQLKTIQAVKADMESSRVMDRLVCGDVGFGKTEVAIRAAFKAATDGKQVAILVPTTVLAFQHYRSFSKRLKDFPVKVEYLNRFRTAKQKKAVLEGLENGSVDIVIGTHQLTSKDVKFKDLGLLIVDEEHKFGVAAKDKLKSVKHTIDTLTLTATPIPRTMQFSLMAARDLSVIKTPPPNRQPIETHVVGFNEEIIRDAVSYEIQRGGQVFVIHNRIENIKEIAGMIQRLVPDAKIAIGHAQLEAKKLENIMLDFMEGEYDVLVSTTIVESGLDVPNANTIIINDAQNFGLADLHQMRGRVGRSNKKAFCYLIAPPYAAMTEEARKRLQALETFTDLGAGFNIAMKDLEIRGAGNILGGEQSGFITEIGFDTYQKILNEAINELKENEFKDVFEEQQTDSLISEIDDVTIDTDFEILIPDEYVNNVEERLVLYNTLSNLETTQDLEDFERNLIDRFGPLPQEVEDLLCSVRIKWLAKKFGFERITIKHGVLLCYFIKNSNAQYYQNGSFQTILAKIQQSPYHPQFKEKPQKDGTSALFLRFEKIHSIQQCYEVLKSFEG